MEKRSQIGRFLNGGGTSGVDLGGHKLATDHLAFATLLKLLPRPAGARVISASLFHLEILLQF